ncbi:hypothetical protein CDD83_2928 [Cordyceps sp. RAO-2017]|nr:hypothetical protein CDD83_2928 [Cordyceps sp. RAO-2017]
MGEGALAVLTPPLSWPGPVLALSWPGLLTLFLSPLLTFFWLLNRVRAPPAAGPPPPSPVACLLASTRPTPTHNIHSNDPPALPHWRFPFPAPFCPIPVLLFPAAIRPSHLRASASWQGPSVDARPSAAVATKAAALRRPTPWPSCFDSRDTRPSALDPLDPRDPDRRETLARLAIALFP